MLFIELTARDLFAKIRQRKDLFLLLAINGLSETQDLNMANLLAIETSTNACSLALQYNGELFHKHLLIPREHTKKILPMINELFAEAGAHRKDIEAIAYGCGPGSFTGLRVSLGIAQGLAYGLDIPLVPVSSLMATAEIFRSQNFPSGDVLVAMDARMNELYWGVFGCREGAIFAKHEEKVSSAKDVSDYLTASEKSDDITVIGSGLNYPDLKPYFNSERVEVLPDARAVISIGQNLLNQKITVSALESHPTYLRNSVAWKKRTRLRADG